MDGCLETTFTSGKPGIWMLGWDAVKPYRTDAQVSATALRHGNFDYLTNTVQWDPEIGRHALPNSLYLNKKPAFFEAGSGYVWPWVDPDGNDQAVQASGKGALRRRDAVHAAVSAQRSSFVVHAQ